MDTSVGRPNFWTLADPISNQPTPSITFTAHGPSPTTSYPAREYNYRTPAQEAQEELEQLESLWSSSMPDLAVPEDLNSTYKTSTYKTPLFSHFDNPFVDNTHIRKPNEPWNPTYYDLLESLNLRRRIREEAHEARLMSQILARRYHEPGPAYQTVNRHDLSVVPISDEEQELMRTPFSNGSENLSAFLAKLNETPAISQPRTVNNFMNADGSQPASETFPPVEDEIEVQNPPHEDNDEDDDEDEDEDEDYTPPPPTPRQRPRPRSSQNTQGMSRRGRTGHIIGFDHSTGQPTLCGKYPPVIDAATGTFYCRVCTGEEHHWTTKNGYKYHLMNSCPQNEESVYSLRLRNGGGGKYPPKRVTPPFEGRCRYCGMLFRSENGLKMHEQKNETTRNGKCTERRMHRNGGSPNGSGRGVNGVGTNPLFR